MTSYCRRPLNFGAHERPTVGDIKMSFTSFDHLGWIKCDGSLLSTSDYALLFNVIGYTYGGSGNQFALPDPRARVLGIVGTSTDTTNVPTTRARGAAVGEETHTLTIDEMPRHQHGSVDTTVPGNNDGNGVTVLNGGHTHTINDPEHTHSYLGVNSQNAGSGGDNVAENSPRPTETSGSSATGITINAVADHSHAIKKTGGSLAHNNMQPTLFVGNMFIYSGKTIRAAFPYTTGTDLA